MDLADILALLTGAREQSFQCELPIRLFQFRTWILFPQTQKESYAKWAGFLAAAKYLDRAEENYFVDHEAQRFPEERPSLVNLNDKAPQTLARIELLRRKNASYREIYDQFIGRPGGLLGLLQLPLRQISIAP